ncbi:MAG: DUF3310 domain-containing protein [Sulfurimonas sp.]|nr:DUF3310 domain-containing protein [Sulfurimonas sp.]
MSKTNPQDHTTAFRMIGVKKTMHPLRNTDSTHYTNGQGKKESIFYLEQKMTVTHTIGWCYGNIFKYQERLGKKATISVFVSDIHKEKHLEELKQKDLIKIATFEAYLVVLLDLSLSGRSAHFVSDALKGCGYDFDYDL